MFDVDTIRPYLHLLSTVNFNVLHILSLTRWPNLKSNCHIYHFAQCWHLSLDRREEEKGDRKEGWGGKHEKELSHWFPL